MTYQLATIQSANGPRAAMILDGRAVDIAAATGRRTDETVLGLLEALDETIARLDALAATNPAGVALDSTNSLASSATPAATGTPVLPLRSCCRSARIHSTMVISV